jgi:hypothetical protein
MLVATVRARRQLARTPGIVRWASVVGSPTEFWTLTVWSGVHELQEFMRSGVHGDVMWKMPRWLESFWLARWRPGAREVGAWEGLALSRGAAPARFDGGGAEEGAEFVRRALAAGTLTYEQSPLVRRSRARLADLGGVVVRVSGPTRALPGSLRALRRLRRALRDDPSLIRVFVGGARFRDAYLFALWRDPESARRLVDGDWARGARERWGERLWILEWLPENEFGHWDGLRMRALAPARGARRSPGGRETRPSA